MAVIDSARTSQQAETEATESFSETAEAVLALYAAHGVDYIFINPGTDTFPLQEAYARRMELGLPCPQAVMCIHEHVAVSAAHGYYLATGRPQVVQVHVDLGTINNTFTTPTTGAGTFAVFTTSDKLQDHIIRVGLNYRFGGPVVARY